MSTPAWREWECIKLRLARQGIVASVLSFETEHAITLGLHTQGRYIGVWEGSLEFLRRFVAALEMNSVFDRPE